MKTEWKSKTGAYGLKAYSNGMVSYDIDDSGNVVSWPGAWLDSLRSLAMNNAKSVPDPKLDIK